MRTKTRGVARDGELLSHGIAWCARCGHKMYVRYKGGGEYVCNHLRSHEGLPACQHIRAPQIDVADGFLTALAPNSNGSGMPPRWPSASSTVSIRTTGLSPTNSSVGGKRPGLAGQETTLRNK
jgi:Recombinase zinc beta ribbon domain